jgi:hypothetical protein
MGSKDERRPASTELKGCQRDCKSDDPGIRLWLPRLVRILMIETVRGLYVLFGRGCGCNSHALPDRFPYRSPATAGRGEL